MQNVDTKVVGYALLVIGIVAICLSGYNVYQVFTGNAQPIGVFSFDGISMSLAGLIDGPVPVGQVPEVELIKPEILNETTNLIAHLFLMGFIVNIGAKISNIGVYLLRPINVTLKNGKQKETV